MELNSMSLFVWMLFIIDRTGVKIPEERQPVNCVQMGTPTFSVSVYRFVVKQSNSACTEGVHA